MRLKVTNIVVLLALVLIAAGCAERAEKSADAESRWQNGLPSIVEKAPGVPEIGGLAPGDIPLCYSPDLRTIYVMNYAEPDREFGVITGDYTQTVDLCRLDNGQRTKVASGIPFITLARWSPDGKYLGMAGGGQMHVLNTDNNNLDAVNKLVNIPSAVSFGWSPDSKKVYVEHEYVVNGAVFDVESHEGRPSYEIRENFPIFKAMLSDTCSLEQFRLNLPLPKRLLWTGRAACKKAWARENSVTFPETASCRRAKATSASPFMPM